MSWSQYVVVRYVADRARNEPMNVGIVLWNGEKSHVRVDEEAVERILRDYPNLHRDALSDLEEVLREEARDRSVEEFVDAQRGLPYDLTELREAPGENVNEVIEELTALLVRPPKRHSGGRPSPVAAVERKLKPWIAHQLVTKNHPFTNSRTGKTRKVSFFANHGANLAVDVLSLALVDPDKIRDRAHARAFEYGDILSKNKIRLVSYCPMFAYENLQDANEDARLSLKSVNAEFVTDLDTVIAEIELKLGHPQLIEAQQGREQSRPRRIPANR